MACEESADVTRAINMMDEEMSNIKIEGVSKLVAGSHREEGGKVPKEYCQGVVEECQAMDWCPTVPMQQSMEQVASLKAELEEYMMRTEVAFRLSFVADCRS